MCYRCMYGPIACMGSSTAPPPTRHSPPITNQPLHQQGRLPRPWSVCVYFPLMTIHSKISSLPCYYEHTHTHTYTHSIVCRDGTHNHALLPLDQMDRRLGSSCTKHPLVTVFLTLTSNATRTSTDDDDIVLLYIRLLTRLTCYYAASLTVIVFSAR